MTIVVQGAAVARLVKKVLDFIRDKGFGGEAVRYIIIGALTTLVNFGLFALMTKALGISVTVSNVTAISISIIFAYITNKLVVFRWHSETRASLALEFVKFVGSRLFTMALEIGAVALFVSVLKQDELIGKAVSQIVVIILNYIISKVIVFRPRR